MTEHRKLMMIPARDIERGPNVRGLLPNIAELADSIREVGLLQPMTVCPNEAGTAPEVLIGFRRHAACMMVDPAEPRPVVAVPRPNEADRLILQAAENIDRVEMSPLDEARLFGRLAELGMGQVEIARRTRRSQSHVSRCLKLLRCPAAVQEAVDYRRLSIWDAVYLPPDLYAKPGLAKACVSGPAFRAWIAKHSDSAVVARHVLPYWSPKISGSYGPLVRAAAKAAGMSIPDYVEAVLDAALGLT